MGRWRGGGEGGGEVEKEFGEVEGIGGVSRTGPGVITLIDTSPHAHPPQGPIRELALGRGGGYGAGTGAACDCIMGVIALVIFVYPRVAPPTAHSPQTQRAH